MKPLTLPRKAALILILLLKVSLASFAQISIQGRVQDITENALPSTNILLLHAADSSLVGGTVSDMNGAFTFNKVTSGHYLINTLMIGYQSTYTSLEIGEAQASLPFLTVEMQEDTQQLDEVTVTATKLLYELKQDRMVMNIDAFPTMSGNTGLELLQKIPGIIVDRQNSSIGMNAKGEVLVMINNKIQRVPGAVLMAQLQGMRAENIQQIEIIHQPPAKYDASGAAGIIHIVLKKNDQQGTNGSVGLTGGYGQREKAGLSLNLNSRKGKFNWFGDYN